jgi:Protein of unknown function, DUF488
MAKARKLFTIGYEHTPAKAVLDELEQAGVKLLVDVRAVAASRRPGFSKNQLAAGLESAAFHICICAGSARRRPAATPRAAASSMRYTRSMRRI